MEDVRSIAIGTRLVVRHRLDDGRATDALGYLVEVSDAHCVIETKRGLSHIDLGAVIAVKRVPPPPEPRVRQGVDP